MLHKYYECKTVDSLLLMVLTAFIYSYKHLYPLKLDIIGKQNLSVYAQVIGDINNNHDVMKVDSIQCLNKHTHAVCSLLDTLIQNHAHIYHSN